MRLRNRGTISYYTQKPPKSISYSAEWEKKKTNIKSERERSLERTSELIKWTSNDELMCGITWAKGRSVCVCVCSKTYYFFSLEIHPFIFVFAGCVHVYVCLWWYVWVLFYVLRVSFFSHCNLALVPLFYIRYSLAMLDSRLCFVIRKRSSVLCFVDGKTFYNCDVCAFYHHTFFTCFGNLTLLVPLMNVCEWINNCMQKSNCEIRTHKSFFLKLELRKKSTEIEAHCYFSTSIYIICSSVQIESRISKIANEIAK